MESKTPSPDGTKLLDYLRAVDLGRHARAERVGLAPRLAALRTWQAERLARTYADLLASPRYADACRFFLTDVYAPRDFSQRDHDIVRIYSSMRSILPPPLLHALELVIRLNALTAELDARLLDVLVDE